MRKEDIEVMETQLNGMKEILNKDDSILKERLEDFFSRLTGYDFKLNLQVRLASITFEIYCQFEFMSLTKPNETDFGSDFKICYEPISCTSKDENHYVIKVSSGTIGEYWYEKKPLNVERAIVMGRMWQKREELENLFKDFCNEFKTDYKNFNDFNRIVYRVKDDLKNEEEEKLFNETKTLIESKDFKFVANDFRNYEVTVTVEKIARVNYQLKATYKYIGCEENKRWYTDYEAYGNYEKEAFVNSYIWHVIKNQNSPNYEMELRAFVCGLGNKLKIAYN